MNAVLAILTAYNFRSSTKNKWLIFLPLSSILVLYPSCFSRGNDSGLTESTNKIKLEISDCNIPLKGVRAHKIPRFSFSIEERGVLGEYVEVAVTRNIQFYVSTAIHHSRSIFRKERKVFCICGHQR